MEELSKKRHSVAHLLAWVVKRLYPEAKLGIGPATEEGFYYDFYGLQIKEEDLPRLEQEVKRLAKQGVSFERKEISLKEAKELFKDEPFKL
ncbi:threonine--tRNA ligase, partial [bacterium]|nr:threonine--tRNA ligase [bacterium]